MGKEQVLTVEKIQGDEEDKFLIRSAKEIQLTLQAIAKGGKAVIMYYNHEQSLMKTLLLFANNTGIWLDISQNEEENSNFLQTSEVILVTMHQGAKVQFTCEDPIMATYAGNPSYYFPLPIQMLRLQRREYFRLSTAGESKLTCVIPMWKEKATSNKEVIIMDISVGGIQLSCKEAGLGLQEGEIYHNCIIKLPGIGTLIADIEVRNLFDVEAPSGAVIKHAGCQFLNLDNQQTLLLQRYIGQMQRNAASNRMQ